MALEEYRKKRDFKKSPEPEGKVVPKKKSKGLFFCVQKHLASHLHYDFRLEHNGVLLSWAVPKGPSLDPASKRLAMHVEDHPIEYGSFEGVIPEGYGAGIVMLWDQGTWTPGVDDVDAALKKGDLKFTLDGYKLKGSWVLVRTKGWPGATNGPGGASKSWLLIKHTDEWAGDVDIIEFAPKSVKSEGDFEDILAADTPAIWLSKGPTKGGEASKMLAEVVEKAAKLKAGRAKKKRVIKALTFDVFGTTVDHRGTIIAEGEALGRAKRLTVDWATFADVWRRGYKPAMNRVRTAELPWTTLDQLHRQMLDTLVADFDIPNLSAADRDEFNRVWHRLTPWPDAIAGLARLKRKFIIAPLSNGNVALLTNMAKHAGLPWDVILGCDLAKHYKPDREVYQMACDVLNLAPSEIMMVAAHQDDLAAAQKMGFKTAFVTRPEEGPNGEPTMTPTGAWEIVARDFGELATALGA